MCDAMASPTSPTPVLIDVDNNTGSASVPPCTHHSGTLQTDTSTARSEVPDGTACSGNGTIMGIEVDADMPISAIEKSNSADRRTSKSGKRRSGFSRGRVSLMQLSHCNVAGDDNIGSELYKQIPVDLTPSKRLALLNRLALRHTLEILGEKFEDVPGFDNFKREALEICGGKLDEMETDGTYEQICNRPSQLQNPINLQMETTIQELKRSIDRLLQEDKDWKELVSNLEKEAQEAKEKLDQLSIPNMAIPDDVKALSLSFLPPESEMIDVDIVCTETINQVKEISLLMDNYSRSVQLLSCASRIARKVMDSLVQTLGNAHSSEIQDPKEQIKELLSR